MLPGFTGLQATNRVPEANQDGPAVKLAGLWDIPATGTCRFQRTDTFCTGLVLWCTEVYRCWTDRDPVFGKEESRTPYPCGVCVGVTNPSDW